LNKKGVVEHITNWLNNYCDESKMQGFVVGISGGIDSALTSTLCALTGKKTVLVTMPIRQTKSEYDRAKLHISDLLNRFEHVEALEINLTDSFTLLEQTLPVSSQFDHLTMANVRSRLRMTTLYAIAQPNKCLVAGTGNKIEDFGVGFFTKYGDGGVDLSPIADLTKTQVRQLAEALNVIKLICEAAPTDGLWEDGRTDEDQIGASYPELEWAMDFNGNKSDLSERQSEVLSIYTRLNRLNQHKMNPIPVCKIPLDLF
jgi:NAD+ synthase